MECHLRGLRSSIGQKEVFVFTTSDYHRTTNYYRNRWNNFCCSLKKFQIRSWISGFVSLHFPIEKPKLTILPHNRWKSFLHTQIWKALIGEIFLILKDGLIEGDVLGTRGIRVRGCERSDWRWTAFVHYVVWLNTDWSVHGLHPP